jgi:hypothetical protein
MGAAWPFRFCFGLALAATGFVGCRAERNDAHALTPIGAESARPSSKSPSPPASLAPATTATDEPLRSPYAQGSWRALDGAGACGAIVASDPAARFGAPRWLRCDDAPDGCVALSLSNLGPPAHLELGAQPMRLVGRAVMMAFEREKGPFRTAIVTPIDGPARWAAVTDLRAPTACIAHPSIGEAGVLARFDVIGDGRDRASDGKTLVAAGRWSELPALRTRWLARSAFGAATAEGAVTRVVVGGRGGFLDTVAPAGVQPIDLGTLDVTLAVNRSHAAIGVVDGALSLHLEVGAIDHVANGGASGRWMGPADGKLVTAMAFDEIAGDEVAWIEANVGDPTYRATTLWASGYGKSEEDRPRQRLADLADMSGSGGEGMVFGAGSVALALDDRRIGIVDAIEAHAWLVRAPGKLRFTRPLWIDDRELFVAVGVEGDRRTTGIVRLARDRFAKPSSPSTW